MARLDKLTGIVATWIKTHKDHNLTANLSTGVKYLKGKGINIKEYALKRRCDFANVKTN